MLKPILLVPAAALLLLAGEGIYHAVRSRHAVDVTCDDLARGRRPGPRLRITGCDIDYAAAGYRESRGQIEELLIPARPAQSAAMPAAVVIATRSPSVIALARRELGSGRTASNERAVQLIRELVTRLHASPAIEGLARVGVLERLRSGRILSGLGTPVARNAVIVDLQGTPDLVLPLVALAAGASLAGLAFWPSKVRPSTSRSTAIVDGAPRIDPPAAAAAAPPFNLDEDDRPPAAASRPVMATRGVSLPRLMLLAVDVSSGPEAIESAPPLGSRSEVEAILRGVIPDLSPGARPATLARPDGSVIVDIGAAESVATAVVEARGEAGVALVKEVLLMTGWRAFAPKTGLFVSADDLEALAALAAEGPPA